MLEADGSPNDTTNREEPLEEGGDAEESKDQDQTPPSLPPLESVEPHVPSGEMLDIPDFIARAVWAPGIRIETAEGKSALEAREPGAEKLRPAVEDEPASRESAGSSALSERAEEPARPTRPLSELSGQASDTPSQISEPRGSATEIPTAPPLKPVVASETAPVELKPPPQAQEKGAAGEGQRGEKPRASMERGTSVFQFAGDVAARCYSLLGDWQIAKDATAETIIEVLRTSDWDPTVEESAQRERVLAIAQNVSMDQLRRWVLVGGASALSDTSSGLPSSPQTPTVEISAASGPAPPVSRTGALKALSGLGEPHRSIVKMRLWGKKSIEEISRGLGKTPQSVVSIYRSALKGLERWILEQSPGFEGEKDSEPEPEADKESAAPGEPTTLPQECIELEENLSALFGPPEGRPEQSLLISVARRVLSATAHIVGTIRFADGPFDLIPAQQKRLNPAKLKGESLIEHRAGARVFGSEVILAGSESTVLVGVEGGPELCLAPGSGLMLGPIPGSDETRAAAVIQGRVLCCPGPRVDGDTTVTFPGGAAAVFYDSFHVSVLSLASSRVEVLEGNLTLGNKGNQRKTTRGDALVCKAGSTAQVVEVRSDPAVYGWLATAAGRPGFPEAARDRIRNMVSPPSRPSTRAPISASRTGAAEAELKKKLEERKKLLIGGAVIAAVVIVALFLYLRGGSSSPILQGWFDTASRTRRAALGLPDPGPGAPPAMFTFRGPQGQLMTLDPGTLPYSVNPREAFERKMLTLEGYQQARAEALTAIKSDPSWPTEPQKVVQDFCERLKNRSSTGLDLLVPGIPKPLWDTMVMWMAPATGYTIQPPTPAGGATAVTLFPVQIQYGSLGLLTYEIAVVSDDGSGGRPYIDALATRWSSGPAAGPPGL